MLSHFFKFFNSTDEVGTGGEYLHCSGASTNTVNLQQLGNITVNPNITPAQMKNKVQLPECYNRKCSLILSKMFFIIAVKVNVRWSSIFNIGTQMGQLSKLLILLCIVE